MYRAVAKIAETPAGMTWGEALGARKEILKRFLQKAKTPAGAAALLGALGAAGLGVKAYRDEVSKTGAKLPDATTTPSPPSVPKMPAPSVASPAKIDVAPLAGPGGPTGGVNITSPKPPVSAAAKTDTGKEVTASIFDEGMGPLLAGGAGGVGGYLLGSKVINPLLYAKEQDILNKIRTGEKVVAGLQKSQKVAPFVAGAVSALILASLAAYKARQNEKQKIERQLTWGQLPTPATSGSGFNPLEQIQFGQAPIY